MKGNLKMTSCALGIMLRIDWLNCGGVRGRLRVLSSCKVQSGGWTLREGEVGHLSRHVLISRLNLDVRNGHSISPNAHPETRSCISDAGKRTRDPAGGLLEMSRGSIVYRCGET